MSVSNKTREALARHDGVRVAAGPDEEGANPFHKGRGLAMPSKRQIPKDHAFDPKSLKPLVKTLWALSVSLGHALTAHRQFSRLKSISFSPDGLVGGRGYVMGVKDVRQALHEAAENISTVCDAIYDEINAPHWKPKLGQLEQNDEEFVKLLDDAKGYMEDPEGEAEEDMEEVEERPASKTRFKTDDDSSKGSRLPHGGDEGNDSQGPNPASANRPQLKQSSLRYSYDRTANSSVPPGSLPGPRVEHLDRAEEDQGGFMERPHERGYDYPSDWDNNLNDRMAIQAPVAESGLPNDADTRTEGYDFGIGDGNGNDAHGQGAGGYENPTSDGKGVYGPRAELPGTPAKKSPNTGLESVEPRNKDLGIPMVAHRVFTAAELDAMADLPGDDQPPVARSDYYTGPKGNDMDVVTRLGETSEAELPGDGSGGVSDTGKSLPNEALKGEQVTQPYVKWDYNTHNMRPDYIYQRDPEGPYVKQ